MIAIGNIDRPISDISMLPVNTHDTNIYKTTGINDTISHIDVSAIDSIHTTGAKRRAKIFPISLIALLTEIHTC